MIKLAEQGEKLLSVSAVARRLNVNVRTVRVWITFGLRGKKLKAIRAADVGMWRIAEADLQAFITSNEDPHEGAMAK